MEAKFTVAVPFVDSGRSVCARRAVPIRSTSKIRRQSAMVGEIPAACATARRVPRSATRAASLSRAAWSVTSATNGSTVTPGADAAISAAALATVSSTMSSMIT
jgi:hypothetical protein